MMKASAAFAATRFGLGLRSDRPASIGDDPAAALLEEALSQSQTPLADPGLKPTAANILAFWRYRAAQRQEQEAGRAMTRADPPPPGGPSQERMKPPAKAAMAERKLPAHMAIYQKEWAAKVARLQAAPIGFFERLVDFWSNHFAIEVIKSPLTFATVGAYEREVIRPHVLGRFEDMLLAVAQHPTMLVYLDNWTSVGPNSLAAKRSGKRGLNENFGREIMELHTLGVDGGYDQADVREVANGLTGWTFLNNLKQPHLVGTFIFRPGMHEPGARVVLGKTYRQKGAAQGAAIIADLARHPATARHLSRKLVQAFVADDPPAELVAELADVYLATDGDLFALTKALVTSPKSWEAPRRKLRSPQEFVFAAARALAVPLNKDAARRSLVTLGQMYWQPTSPAGFSGDSRYWLAADAMTDRLAMAQFLAMRTRPVDPQALAETVLGDLLSASTREAIKRAESPAQAYALLVMSPEFQRR